MQGGVCVDAAVTETSFFPSGVSSRSDTFLCTRTGRSRYFVSKSSSVSDVAADDGSCPRAVVAGWTSLTGKKAGADGRAGLEDRDGATKGDCR